MSQNAEPKAILSIRIPPHPPQSPPERQSPRRFREPPKKRGPKPIDAGGEFIDALFALKLACQHIGIKPPIKIGMHSGFAVEAIGEAMKGRRTVTVKPITGGFEVAGIEIKVSWK